MLADRHQHLIPHLRTGLTGQRYSYPTTNTNGDTYTVHITPIMDAKGEIRSAMAHTQPTKITKAAA